MYRRFTDIVLISFAVAGLACGGSGKKAGQVNLNEPDLFDTSSRNMPPRPTVTLAESCEEGDEVLLQVEANDPDSTKLTYMYDWDGNGVFDDVNTAAEMRHSWKRDGTYRVRVRVQDDRRASGEDQVTIVVKDRAPEAAFEIKGNPSETAWVTVDASASRTVTDPLVKYEWDWNYDGVKFRPADQQGVRVETRWMRDGNYVVALRVTDSDGSTTMSTKALHVADQTPVAKIFGPGELMVDEIGSFSGQDSYSPADEIVGFYWDLEYSGSFTNRLGDSRPVIQKSWHTPGTYQIALQVRDKDGSTGLATQSVRIKAPKPAPVAKPAGKKDTVSNKGGLKKP